MSRLTQQPSRISYAPPARVAPREPVLPPPAPPTAPPPVPPAPEARRRGRARAEAEERAKDLVTFRQGSKRRVRSIALIGAGLYGASLTGMAEVSLPLAMLVIGGGLAGNAMLTALTVRSPVHRWWFRYAFAAFDAALISCAVVIFGHLSLAALYFLVIIPYSFDRGRRLGYFAAGCSAAGLLLASWGYHLLNPGLGAGVRWTVIAALVLLGVSSQVVPIPARLIRRVRHTRDAMNDAERGDLLVRADAHVTDELGFLEQSFNRMLEELGRTIATVQREAGDVAAHAEQVARTAQALQESGSEFTSAALSLATELDAQRGHTSTGARRAADARTAAEGLRDRAAGMEDNARALLDAADTSRDAIGRAGTTLVTLGDRVRDAATTASRLSSASEEIGDFAEAVSRIARQTNLLALNAAIEAARAGEHGKGFGVVAEEVRKLAEESAQAAKRIAGTIGDVREHIGTVVEAMAAGQREVGDVGRVAAEANTAIGAIASEIARVAAVVTETASVSRAQVGTMEELWTSIRGVETVSAEAAARAQEASQAAARQTAALHGLTTTSGALAGLADRLRESISRFEAGARG